MNGKRTIEALTKEFETLDELRRQTTEALIKAANQAFGADVFKEAGYFRDSTGIIVRMNAKIPSNNPSGFSDGSHGES